MSRCRMCEKPLAPPKRLYCSDKCGNRAAWIKQYGLTPEDYRAMLGDGRCPICGRKMRKVNVDHDHKTKQVRGLVCGTCNKRVLTVINTPLLAFNLLKYLVDNPATLLGEVPRIVGKIIRSRDEDSKRRFRRNGY